MDLPGKKKHGIYTIPELGEGWKTIPVESNIEINCTELWDINHRMVFSLHRLPTTTYQCEGMNTQARMCAHSRSQLMELVQANEFG